MVFSHETDPEPGSVDALRGLCSGRGGARPVHGDPFGACGASPVLQCPQQNGCRDFARDRYAPFPVSFLLKAGGVVLTRFVDAWRRRPQDPAVVALAIGVWLPSPGWGTLPVSKPRRIGHPVGRAVRLAPFSWAQRHPARLSRRSSLADPLDSAPRPVADPAVARSGRRDWLRAMGRWRSGDPVGDQALRDRSYGLWEQTRPSPFLTEVAFLKSDPSRTA